jgi:hypothetical protein
MVLYLNRRPWRRWLRLATILLLFLLSIDFLMLVSLNPPLKRVPTSLKSSENGARKERIFIASMHWNNEKIIRSHWGAAVLDLVRYFGVENVYISIVESGSWDDTKGALRELDAELEKLGVERSIELLETTHTDQVTRVPEENEEGWIWTSRGRNEMRRIPYLAKVRNRVMEKLKHLAERTDGQEKRSFDKVLWLNDVIFTVSHPFAYITAQVTDPPLILF